MAESKKIKGTDLIAPDFLLNSIEQAEKFLEVIKETKKAIVETNKATSAKLKTASSGSASKDIKEANALMAEAIKQRNLYNKAAAIGLKAELDLDKAIKARSDFDKKKKADDEKYIKIIERQNSAYAQASDKLNKLRHEYKDLAIAGKGADKATQDMLKTIQALDKELKKVDADVGQFNRSVGDYKNQMSEAITETGLFTEGLNKLGTQQNEIIAGFGAIVNQLKGLKKAEDAAEASAGKFGKTLKATGIGVLIAGLISLFSFFTGSRRGILEFDLAMAKLKGTLDVLLGSLGKVGNGLVLLFKTFGVGFEAFKKKLDAFTTFNPTKRAQLYKEASDLATEANKLQSESMDLLTHAFDGNIDRTKDQIKGYEDLAIAIFKLEDELLKLNIILEQAKMDEEDYNEIQSDTTLTLKEQKKALEGAIRERLTQAKIGKEIADKEYASEVLKIKQSLRKNMVNEEGILLLEKQGYQAFLNSKYTLDVLPDELKAIQEKFLAQKQADDKLDDLNRQDAESRREIIQTETIAQIELIRSKKLGADEQVKILTKQVNDEKNQLEERVNFEEQLRAKQLEAQNEEVKQFEKFIYARYEGGKLIESQAITAAKVNELIAEKDAVALAKKIKDTNLSVIQQEELAKVILEAQTNDLAYQEQLAKFEDERIKREQKILQLNREIFIINEQSTLTEVEKIEAERQRIVDESNQNILQSNNVFNRKLLEQRKLASLEGEIIIEEEYKIKEDLLKKQYEIDQENIKNSVNDEKVREKELEKLKASFDASEKKLEDDKEKGKLDSLNKELEAIKAIEIKRYDIILSNLEKATAALSEELDKRQAIQDKNASNQIDKTESTIDKQRDLAARGLENTLAYQESQLDKQKLKQQDAERKAAKEKENLALAESLFNAYNAELKQPNSNPTTAASKALADVLLFKGLAAGFVQFAADGNDRVQGPGTTTSDSIPFMLSKDEGVVKASANMDNPGAVSSLNNGTFDQMYIPRYSVPEINDTGQNISNSLVLQSNKEVIDLLKDIKNKPVQHVDVDKLGNLIETTYKDGLKTVTKYKNRRSIG